MLDDRIASGGSQQLTTIPITLPALAGDHTPPEPVGGMTKEIE